MNIVRFARRNSRAVFLLTGFLLVAGAVAIFRLPSNIYPELTFPRVVILAHSGDLSPQFMLLRVTRPLEESVATVLGARRVRSKTIRGGAEISVLFNPDMDMQYALQLVEGRVNEARGSLPPDTEIQVERLTPAIFPIVSLILNGDVPAADLRDYAYYVLRPLFSRVPGVSRIDVQASSTREVSVIVDPQQVLSHRLSLVDISDRLRATNAVNSVGRLDKNYSQYLVLSTGQFTNLDDVRNTVVAVENGSPIRLRDIAEVRDGVEDRRTLIAGNGRPAALINIARQIGGNILEISGQVEDLATHLGSAVPPTLHLSVVYDLAGFVRDSIGNVRDAILLGGLLVIGVLYLFLREGRSTLVAAISLPVTVVSTFFFMGLLGGTLNLMSLGGMAIAIGLIIDDAVVVVENTYRHVGLGKSAAGAAEAGAQELLGPVVGSTVTTVVVFLPLGLLKGVVGEFFRALCLTLALAVLLSLLFALMLIPLLAERFISEVRFRRSSQSLIEPVNRAYERAVRSALRHRWVVVAGTVVSVAVTVLLYYRVETGFLPEMDEGGYVVDYLTPPGTSLHETDRLVRLIEDRIKRMPETAAFSRRTGAEMGFFATVQNEGDILVKLKPRTQRKRDVYQVINDLRDQVTRNIPGIQIEFVQLLQDMIGDLEGEPQPVEIKLFGSDMKVLEDLAEELGPRIQKIPGIVDYKGIQKGNPEIVFHVDPLQAGRLGLTVEQVSEQASAGLLGITTTELRQADRTIGIRVRYPDAFRFDYSNVRQFPIVTPGKQIVPLSAFADIEQVRGETQLMRENQRLMALLTARLEERDLGGAIRDVKAALSATAFPVGTTYEIGGQYEAQQSAFRDLLYVFSLALTAVFIVLVVQFRAFGPSLVILSAAPLSLFGVFVMLALTDTALNVSSFMGIILMVGLVVKNGIILFDYVHKLRVKEAVPLTEALIAAGKIRVRPILMTTLCTLFGLLPLALGLGSGAELQKPLALAVIGGLSVSMFITLLVMPVLYSLLEEPRS
ncbi:MAG: efflux RND transporter permease subunit [Terriglobia bacterium]